MSAIPIQITNNSAFTLQLDGPVPSSITSWSQSCSGSSGTCAPGVYYIVPAGSIGWGSLASMATGLQLSIYSKLQASGAPDMTSDKLLHIEIDSSGNISNAYGLDILNYTIAVTPAFPEQTPVWAANQGWAIIISPKPVLNFINRSAEVLTVTFSGQSDDNINLSNYLMYNAGAAAAIGESSIVLQPSTWVEVIDRGNLINSFPYTTATITTPTYNASIAYQSSMKPTVAATKASGATQSLTSYVAPNNAYTLTYANMPATAVWDATTSTLKLNGAPVLAKGFSLTTTEYQLQGLGMQSFAILNVKWPLPASPNSGVVDISVPNEYILDKLTSNIMPSTGVIPTVRIPLNAAYYLNVVTSGWENKFSIFNSSSKITLSAQYIALIDNMVNYFTARGIVSILDLHWNDDVTKQNSMALKDPVGSTCAVTTSTTTPCSGPTCCTTGDSVAFWTAIATKYASNQYVWFEVYNEPFDPNATSQNPNPANPSPERTTWTGIWGTTGNSTYYDVNTLYTKIREVAPNNIVIVSGAFDYAFDDISLIAFNKPSLTNVMYNFHPYLGGPQGSEKSPSLLLGMINNVQTNTNRPVIITESGQYCCSPHGECGNPGTFNAADTVFTYTCPSGTTDNSFYIPTNNLGYLEAVVSNANANNVSWTLWAWNPSLNGTCCPIVVNNGYELNSPTTTASGWSYCDTSNQGPLAPGNGCCTGGSCGADFVSIMANYYGKAPSSKLVK